MIGTQFIRSLALFLCLLFLFIIAMLLPSPNPYGPGYTWFPSSFYILFMLNESMYYYSRNAVRYSLGDIDQTTIFSFIGWFFLISIVVLFVVILIFGIDVYLSRHQKANELKKVGEKTEK